MENNNQNDKIISLLEEQNSLLKELVNYNHHREKQEMINGIIHLIIQLLPFIAVFIVIGFLYYTFKGYLDTINHNINVLKDGFLSFQEGISKLIPDFSGIKDSLNQTWQNVKGVF